MKKTLLVTLDFYPSVGGVSHYWMSLGRYLSHDRWIVLAPPLPPSVQELAVPYRIIRAPFFYRFIYPQWLPLFFSLLKVLLCQRIEVMIVGQILPVGTVVSFLARIFRIPYIVSTHGMDVALPLHVKRKKELCKRILAHAHFVVTVSRYTASKLFELGVHTNKVRYIYPCPAILPQDISKRRYDAPKTAAKECILLTVGRLVRRKGHEHVLSAFAELQDFTPPLTYVIVGDGPYAAELQSLTRQLKITDRVLFTGLLAERAVQQWYAKCDICIMTPYDRDGDVEGFGTVYLEANAFGKPVIASRSGGVPDAVIHDKTGLLVEPGNVEEIKRAILRLARDPGLSTQLGRQGRQRVEKEFQWSAQAEQLQKLL